MNGVVWTTLSDNSFESSEQDHLIPCNQAPRSIEGFFPSKPRFLLIKKFLFSLGVEFSFSAVGFALIMNLYTTCKSWGPTSLNTAQSRLGEQPMHCPGYNTSHTDSLPKSRLTFQIECSCDRHVNLIHRMRRYKPQPQHSACRVQIPLQGERLLVLGKHPPN